MLHKNIWSFLWTVTILQAVALASKAGQPVPSQCYLTSVQILCADFYIKTIDKCILNSLPTDIFVKAEKEICYVVHPERCISADFCPQAKVNVVMMTHVEDFPYIGMQC